MATNRLNLMLHCGGNAVGLEEVSAVKTPDPTETWCPIPHRDYIDRVVSGLGQTGLHVVNEAHALWKGGDRYFGALQLENGASHDDYALVVGLRNSHDKTFPAGLACGSGVFVCDNLAFSGEVRLSRKHTRWIQRDLPRLVATAVGKLGQLRVKQERRIEAYKNFALSDKDAHDLLVQAVDTQALPCTKLPAALQEWRKPSHDEFSDRTAWSLFNSVTEVLRASRRSAGEAPEKNVPANRILRRTVPLHGLFDRYCECV